MLKKSVLLIYIYGEATPYDLSLASGSYGHRLIPENTWLMEIKISGAIPVHLAGILSELKIYSRGFSKNDHMILKVTVPENLDYQNLLTDILSEYTLAYRLKNVRTVDFGALFETVYYIELKKDCNRKEMIDKIRTRNGNLNVQLLFKEYEDKLYQTQ